MQKQTFPPFGSNQKHKKKNFKQRKISRSILREVSPHLRFGFSCEEQIYHLLAPKGGAKSVRRAKKSGNGRRLAPKTLRGRARARVFDGAAAARSSSRFSAMRSLLCASRNNDLLRFEFLSSHLAGFRPAGSHCEKSGKSDDTCASARSGCAKQRSLLCPLSERGWRHPLLFAVLDLLVLLDQAKSTEEKNTRQKKSILRKEFRRQDRLRRICGPKAVGHAHGGGPPQAETSTRTAQRSAIFQAGLWGFARPKPGLHGTLLREFPKSSFKQEISARPAPFRPARRPPPINNGNRFL